MTGPFVKSSPETEDSFTVPRRRLNLPNLLRKKAVRITHQADGKGGVVRNGDRTLFTIVTIVNEQADQAGIIKQWPDKPESYDLAFLIINSSKPNLGDEELCGDEKYRQILQSANQIKMNDDEVYISDQDYTSIVNKRIKTIEAILSSQMTTYYADSYDKELLSLYDQRERMQSQAA